MVGEQCLAKATGVVAGIAQRGVGAPGTGGSVDGDQQCSQEQPQEGRPDHRGDRPLPDDRLHAEVLGPVHAQQHDHEQEEDDHGAGVDDDLDGSQEGGVLEHEEHGDAEQGLDEKQGCVDRVAGHQHATGATQDDGRADQEDGDVHQADSPSVASPSPD